MSNLEQKINALMNFALAEDQSSRDAAVSQLRELMAPHEERPAPACGDRNQEIQQLLRELGVPVNLKGYSRLVSAIDLAMDIPEGSLQITKNIYPAVADKHQDSPSRVERAIRHAIETSLNRGDLAVMERYFGNTISSNKGKPTNAEFIANVANIVRMRTRAA